MEEQHFRYFPCELNSMMVTIRLVSVSVQWSQITVITILHNNFTNLCVHVSNHDAQDAQTLEEQRSSTNYEYISFVEGQGTA